MAVEIPIFLSKPTRLNPRQRNVLRYVNLVLKQECLLPRTLGQSDFPQTNPIAEACHLARACYGGLILGFTQIKTPRGLYTHKPESRPKTKDKPRAVTVAAPEDTRTPGPVLIPSPWNHLEAGMLVALRKPLLVFAEKGIAGGIFDKGAFSGFMQEFDPEKFTPREREIVRERVRLWSAEVRWAFRV